ncbi:MAG: dihydrolipoyllysine-residue acetyltransferase [Vulcanimicrobiaceae bacterium]
MSIEVRVPDIGDFHEIPVIEVLVKPGDTVKKEQSLVTLESEKATMEVPADKDGVVESVAVKVGDKVSQGTVLLTLQGEAPAQSAPTAATAEIQLTVPDIGDFTGIPVIEVLIKPGDTVTKEQSLVTLESEKATMEVPASASGVIADVRVKVGDKVSHGTVIAILTATAQPAVAAGPTPEPTPLPPVVQTPTSVAPVSTPVAKTVTGAIPHASPSLRRLAREFGIDLHLVTGTGPNARITREDVQMHVKRALSASSSATTSFAGLPAWPTVDFAAFGPIDRKPLPRIKKFSGPNLHRNWLSIPHITNYDQADITDLEAFRKEVNAERKSDGAKITILAFLIKACVAALQKFPDFNTSLDGDELIYKRYYNIGFAADTPGGLVVPVIKNADHKGIVDIAAETAELAGKARDGKLAMTAMQGGTFTISSIGGIGGTQFTQIVNAPEVAILGSARSSMQPIWDGKQFAPRLILPISVSYDHRVIDGAGAARFLVYLAELLGDFRRVML